MGEAADGVPTTTSNPGEEATEIQLSHTTTEKQVNSGGLLITSTTRSDENVAEVFTLTREVTTEIYPTTTTSTLKSAVKVSDDDLPNSTTERQEEAEDFFITSTSKSEQVTEDVTTEKQQEAEELHNSTKSAGEVTEDPPTDSTTSKEEDIEDLSTETADDTEYLSGKARKGLVSHLDSLDLEAVDSLVLSPRQETALRQELKVRRLGLAPWSDLSPWQRLRREEQVMFNEKYLALPASLQDYSRLQFTSLPEDRQEHAYRMFLTLDIETLKEVIARELERQREVEILFDHDGGENYGEFPEVKLESQTTVTPPQVRITTDQLRQLRKEVHQQNDTHLEDVRADLPRQILQISPEQIKQLGHQIDLIDNSIDDSVDTSKERYEEDFYEAFTGVNETLQKVQEKVDEKTDDLTTVEPSTARDIAHTTALYEELEASATDFVPAALYSDGQDDKVTTDSPSSLYDENYLYEQPTGDGDPATSAPDTVTRHSEDSDQTEKTTDNILTIEDLVTSDIKKVNNESFKSKFESFPTKKIVFRKKKNPQTARKSSRQRPVTRVSTSSLKRKTISQDARLRAWQARARSRHAYDPRRSRRVERGQHSSLSERTEDSPATRAQLLHFKIAEAQLASAQQLQECLQNASACEF